MKLDRKILPFIPQYYEPITLSMSALRHESLNLYNSGLSHSQFGSNKTVECRLLKDDHHIFTLILQNISGESLTVDYYEMKNIKYSNRIKILSWGNKLEINAS
jgi:hypothetical protein